MLLRPSLQAMAAKFIHLYLRTFSRYLVCPGEGVVRISSDRDDRKIFLGLKVSISGFWLFNLKIRDSSRVSWRRSSCRNFYGSQIRHGIFWGLNFGSRIFLGSHWNPWDFWEVFIFAPIRSSLSLEIRSSSPPPLPTGLCVCQHWLCHGNRVWPWPCFAKLAIFTTDSPNLLLTWPASMQIYGNKRKRCHTKRVQLP